MHDDLQHAFSRVALHPSRIQAAVNLRDTSGVKRFSAAAHLVLSEIHEHHRKSSWGFLRQRRELRKAFVGALVRKLAFDQAANIWPNDSPPPGIDEVRALYQQLAEEISPFDKPMWTLLARWEYRRISVHLYVVRYYAAIQSLLKTLCTGITSAGNAPNLSLALGTSVYAAVSFQ